MKCPNCGRNVRSKTQCAYCGYDFKAGDVAATEPKRSERTEQTPEVEVSDRERRVEAPIPEVTEFRDAGDIGSSDVYETRSAREQQTVIPKTKRKGGNAIWGIIKLLIAVAVVFLLFLYGPRLVGQVMDYFNSEDNFFVQTFGSKDESSEVESNVVSEESTLESDSAAEGDSVEDGSSDVAETQSALTLTNQSVELENYPTIGVTMTFEEALSSVDQSTFTFLVSGTGEEIELSEYSLFKEGNNLVLSFNDPTLEVVAATEQEQTLRLVSEELNVDEAVTYTLPDVNIDQAQAQQFNDSINNNLADLGDVSAVFAEAGADVPFAYANQSIDADSLIAWFVIERTFEGLANGEFTLESSVSVNENLLAANDIGTVASTEVGATYTFEQLLEYVVRERDVSAMNHLIQETGGLNEFNLWLNESGYFSTRLTAPLSYNDEGLISGAMTSAQDLGNLLDALANDNLVNASSDAAIKELLLQSPFSDKYPEGLAGVVTRYELMSSDENPARQYYAGLLETEESAYVVVTLVDNVTSSEEVVPAIATTVEELMIYFNEGSLPAEEDAEEEVVEEEVEAVASETSQVEIVEETPVQETPTTPAEDLSPSGEPVGELFDGKPTENYYWFGDEYRQGIWFQDESGSWKYR